MVDIIVCGVKVGLLLSDCIKVVVCEVWELVVMEFKKIIEI